jgi:hypothetical protein
MPEDDPRRAHGFSGSLAIEMVGVEVFTNRSTLFLEFASEIAFVADRAYGKLSRDSIMARLWFMIR